MILFDQVDVSDVYQFTTEAVPITAFIVETLSTVGTGKLTAFSFKMTPSTNGVSLTMTLPSHLSCTRVNCCGCVKHRRGMPDVQVQKSSQEVVFDFASYFGATLEMDKFVGWDGHWILRAGGFVVQDGEILNRKFDFQEVHYGGWSMGTPYTSSARDNGSVFHIMTSSCRSIITR